MIMTPCATKPKPQKYIGSYIRNVVQNGSPLCNHIPLVVFINPVTQETGGDETVGAGELQLIARKLLQDEAIVRFVCIHRANDIIPISPRFWTKSVLLVTVRLAVAN